MGFIKSVSPFILVLLVSVIRGHPHDCNCDTKHPQDQYCNADFGIFLIILRSDEIIYLLMNNFFLIL